MRTYFFQLLILVFLFSLNSLSAQVSFGASLLLGIPNKITQTGYGLEGFLEFKLTEEISARMTGGIHYTNFEKEGIYDNGLSQNKIYGLIIYHPFKNGIDKIDGMEPYLGLGLGYVSSSYSSTHNAQTINGGYMYNINIDDALGYFSVIGIDIRPLANFHVKAEINYIYLRPNYTYIFESVSPTFRNDLILEKIDLSYIACKLMFVIEL